MAAESGQTVLIPVVFPNPELYPLTDFYSEGLNGFNVVLLGYWEIPEGTTPEVARTAHETEAEAVLYEMAATFSHAGASTDIQLHFGPGGSDRTDLQDRIVEETDADAVLITDSLSSLNNILVPLRDDRRLDDMVDFLSQFDPEMIFVLELYHVASTESEVETAEQMLERVRQRLLDRGFSDADIEAVVEVADDPAAAIASEADAHNIVVMGETEQLDVESRFFGPVYESITGLTDTPIVVIRD